MFVNLSTPQKKGLCALEVSSQGFSFAYTKDITRGAIDICNFFPFKQRAEQASIGDLLASNLVSVISEYGLKGARCICVLNPDYYRLTLINAPNVPQSEYKKAIRWQIKDLITYPIEDAAIDIFFPDEPDRALKKVYVVAAQRSFLQGLIDVIQDSELYPIAVDIREFAIRNLIAELPMQDVGVGFLNLIDDGCLVVVVKRGNIQFVRRIPVVLKSLNADNYANIISELQRSFAYSKSELKQDMPDQFFVSPDAAGSTDIALNIEKGLGKNTSILDIQSVVKFSNPVTPEVISKCWVAIGGILRGV